MLAISDEYVNIRAHSPFGGAIYDVKSEHEELLREYYREYKRICYTIANLDFEDSDYLEYLKKYKTIAKAVSLEIYLTPDNLIYPYPGKEKTVEQKQALEKVNTYAMFSFADSIRKKKTDDAPSPTKISGVEELEDEFSIIEKPENLLYVFLDRHRIDKTYDNIVNISYFMNTFPYIPFNFYREVYKIDSRNSIGMFALLELFYKKVIKNTVLDKSYVFDGDGYGGENMPTMRTLFLHLVREHNKCPVQYEVNAQNILYLFDNMRFLSDIPNRFVVDAYLKRVNSGDEKVDNGCFRVHETDRDIDYEKFFMKLIVYCLVDDRV